MSFKLHPSLETKLFIIDFPLSRVLLQDESHYPWLIVVPRRLNVSRIIDLSPTNQLILIRELDAIQHIMWKEFQPTQLNVAAIGNKTPQLHVHVIARFADDPAWPQTVWDHPVRSKYSEEKRNSIVLRLKSLLSQAKIDESNLISTEA